MLTVTHPKITLKLPRHFVCMCVCVCIQCRSMWCQWSDPGLDWKEYSSCEYALN